MSKMGYSSSSKMGKVSFTNLGFFFFVQFALKLDVGFCTVNDSFTLIDMLLLQKPKCLPSHKR